MQKNPMKKIVKAGMATAMSAGALLTAVGTGSASAYVDVREIKPNHVSGKCLDIQGGSKANGAGLVQYDCTGQDNQKFVFTKIGGLYEIKAKHSNRCLDVQGGSTGSAQIIQYDCTGAKNQRFALSSDSYYGIQIDPANSFGQCFDVQGASKANSANVLSYTCSPLARHQRFDVTPA